MGKLKDLYEKIFKRESIPALPEGEAEVLEDNNKETRQIAFKNQIKNSAIVEESAEYEEELDDGIVYNSQSFLRHPDWRGWYNNPEARIAYFNENRSKKDEALAYKGPLAIIPVGMGVNKIMCTVLDDVTRKPKQIELGTAKGKICNYAMHEIDAILALQVSKMYKGELLSEEIQRHYNELDKLKDVNLSIYGEQICKSTGESILYLPEIEEENLYNKRVDFTELKTKETITQMPVQYKQVIVEDHEMDEIDQTTEELYQYCNLAIDIGIFGKEDWQKIDETHSWTKQQDNKTMKADKRNIEYERSSNYRRESYNEIKFKYLTDDQLKDLRQRKIDMIAKQKTNSNMVGVEDIEENIIRDIVKKAMMDLPIKLEEFILKYQNLHEDEPEYYSKINLLRDMNNYAKINYLENKGIQFTTNKQKDNELDRAG